MKQNKSKNKSSTKTSSKQKQVHVVTSNPRLVEAIKSYSASLAQTQSYLVTMATIVQEEQLTKNEVVASLMEARGIQKNTAESQFSRIKGILMDPKILEKVKSGEMDLQTARNATKKTQTNPSKDKKGENAQKRFAKAISTMMAAAKETAMDLQSILTAVKLAAKKNGIK